MLQAKDHSKKTLKREVKANITNKSIDLQLYKPATKDFIDNLTHMLKRVLIEKQLSESVIFQLFSSLGNMLLHLPSKFGNTMTMRHLTKRDPLLSTRKT